MGWAEVGAVGGAVVGGVAGGPLGAVVGASAGASLGIMLEGPGKAPEAPMPASYYEYDAEGNLVSSRVWDSKKNAYVQRLDPRPSDDDPEAVKRWEARRAEEAALKEKSARLRAQYTSFLEATPEDRLQMYDEYAQAIEGTLHKSVDKQLDELERRSSETLAKRGLLSSRTAVETARELADVREQSAVDISRVAMTEKEALAARDRNFALGVLGYLDQGGRADTAEAIARSQSAGAGAAQGVSALMPGYTGDLAQYQAENQWRSDLSSSLMSTATGLAYMWGMGGGGKQPAGTQTTPKGAQPAYTGAGALKPPSQSYLQTPRLEGTPQVTAPTASLLPPTRYY